MKDIFLMTLLFIVSCIGLLLIVNDINLKTKQLIPITIQVDSIDYHHTHHRVFTDTFKVTKTVYVYKDK